MKNRIARRDGNPRNLDFDHAHRAKLTDDAVLHMNEDHVDAVDVGVDRGVVFSQIVIYEMAQSGVRIIGSLTWWRCVDWQLEQRGSE